MANWRMIQTNLRETDMADISAEEYVKELKEFGANVALLNTSGIIASYKTSIEDHYQSKFLTGDSLKDIVKLCHENGIKVIARMDFSKIRREIYEKHPEWAYRDKDGKIVDYNGDVHTCINGGYQQNVMPEIIRETYKELDTDGTFCNMGGFVTVDYSYNYHGICHCENCKKLFRGTYNLELPEREDMKDSVYRKYLLFKAECLKKHRDKINALVRELEAESGKKIYDGRFYKRSESNTEYKRPLPFNQYDASSQTRTTRGFGNTECVPTNTSVDFIGFAYRQVAVSPAMQELRLWQDIANLGGVDYYIIGRLDNKLDKTGYERVKKVFHFHQKNYKVFEGLKSKSDVLLVREKMVDQNHEASGWIRTLTELHILFDEVLIDNLGSGNLENYKAIILPDIKFISDVVAKKLDQYVKAGGKLIAVGETGFFREDYEKREVQAIKSLGVTKCNYVRDDMKSSMLYIEDNDKEMFPSCKDTKVVAVNDSYIFTDIKEKSKCYCNLIPPHHMGPPERCYYNQKTDLPGVIVNSYGIGESIYLPWYAGKFYFEEGYQNSLLFMKDVLLKIAGINNIKTNASEMVEITRAFDKNKEVLQFVNGSGHFGTSFFDPVPMADITVTIKLDKAPQNIYCLMEDSKLSYNYNEKLKELDIRLGCLKEYQCIIIEIGDNEWTF